MPRNLPEPAPKAPPSTAALAAQLRDWRLKGVRSSAEVIDAGEAILKARNGLRGLGDDGPSHSLACIPTRLRLDQRGPSSSSWLLLRSTAGIWRWRTSVQPRPARALMLADLRGPPE